MRESLLSPEIPEKRKSLSKPKSFIYVENVYDQSPEILNDVKKQRSFDSDLEINKYVRQSCKAPITTLMPPLRDTKIKNIDRS